jgi:hypothetical protein
VERCGGPQRFAQLEIIDYLKEETGSRAGDRIQRERSP